MNCDQITEILDDHLDGTTSGDDQRAVEEHLEHCANCQVLVKSHQELRARLARFGETSCPEPAAGFYDRALARAAQTGARQQRNRWVMTGFGGAVAAGLMVWIVSSVFFLSPELDQPAIPSVTMALESPQTFNLVFSSAAALTDASMTVTLPDGIEVQGFSGQREITWMTSLKKGRNILPLTLIATSPVGGELLATMQHEDDDKLFRLQVSVI
ncbi:MAG: anti-sigma factor family protein [Woeseiaceae bacterium]